MIQHSKQMLSGMYAVVAMSCAVSIVRAQAVVPETREYSRRGELSPGAEAPSPTALIAAINQAAPEKLKAVLEYGERVYCAECVPLLEDKLLGSADARVRELSAWWLRRQPFAAPAILSTLRKVVREDPVPERRARAAEALGEFMDARGFAELSDALRTDPAPRVRSAAVRGLARLNDPRSGAAISAALGDAEPEVKRAALEVVIGVSAFRDYAAIVAVLGDADPVLRAHAARLCGEFRVVAAEQTLVAMLRGDASAGARKAAAWALGRIGGAGGRTALSESKMRETDPLVLSAIAVAERMPVRIP